MALLFEDEVYFDIEQMLKFFEVIFLFIDNKSFFIYVYF